MNYPTFFHQLFSFSITWKRNGENPVMKLILETSSPQFLCPVGACHFCENRWREGKKHSSKINKFQHLYFHSRGCRLTSWKATSEQSATSVTLCYQISEPRIHLFLHLVSQPLGWVLTTPWMSAFRNVSFFMLSVGELLFFSLTLLENRNFFSCIFYLTFLAKEFKHLAYSCGGSVTISNWILDEATIISRESSCNFRSQGVILVYVWINVS